MRLARSEDAKNLGKLWFAQRTYHQQWDELYASVPKAKHDWVKQFLTWLPQKNHCVLVAEDEYGQIMGYVHGSYHSWPLSPFEYYGSLNTIAVAEEARGCGIGKKLVNKLLKWFKERKIQHISIHVDYRNRIALNLYRSVGFRSYQHRLMLNLSNEVEYSSVT
ncbi:MAG: GNAT family N-acetyltransferase [Promethearchaeota archaeon]